MTALKRPLPRRGVYENPFWDAIQMRELRLQKCSSCAHTWYPPGPVCPTCLSEAWSFAPMSGRGKMVAWTIFHRQYFPEIPVPYLVASVQLDEGPLLIGNVPGLDPKDARVDLSLEAVFEQVKGDAADWLILQWRVVA